MKHTSIPKKPPVIVNLIKLTHGYMVEPERIETKFRIPKSIALPPQQFKEKTIQPQQHQQHPQHPPQHNLMTHSPQHMQLPPPPQHYYPYMPPQQQLPQAKWPPQPQPQQPQQPPLQPQLPPQPQVLPPPIVNEVLPADPPKRITQKYQLIIPSCAAWFSLDVVHAIEKEAFPDFFTQQRVSKTPELYKKFRNFIVNLYRNSPSIYLSITSCRKVLAGDACSIARIHGFLQHWGIINFSVDPDSCPGKLLPQPALTKGLYRSFSIEAKDELDDLNAQEIALLNTIKLFSKKYRPICGFCGFQCGLSWYQQKPSKDVKEITLCLKCYANNNFPSILSPEDFEKGDIESKFNVETLGEQGTDTLTEQEFITVLSYIQDNPEASWDLIAGHLNTVHGKAHSQEDVLRHFLQKPLQDCLNLDKTLEFKENLESLGVQELATRLALQEPQIYSDYSNVISYHVALFRKLLNKYMKRETEEVKEPEEKQIHQNNVHAVTNNSNNNNEDSKQLQNSQAERQSEQFNKMESLSQAEVESVIKLRDETVERSKMLQQKEEQKLNEHVNLLINIQMEKLEIKLNFLDEYEKLIMYEKNQLEQCQKFTLAERLMVIQQRQQMMQENNQ